MRDIENRSRFLTEAEKTAMETSTRDLDAEIKAELDNRLSTRRSFLDRLSRKDSATT